MFEQVHYAVLTPTGATIPSHRNGSLGHHPGRPLRAEKNGATRADLIARGVIAKPFSSADIRHGPVAALTEQVPAILLAPRGQVFADLVDVADRVLHAGCPLMVVSDDPELRRRGEGSCELPTGVPEWLAPLILAVPGQQLAGHLAARRGHDIDRPPGLSKITETH